MNLLFDGLRLANDYLPSADREAAMEYRQVFSTRCTHTITQKQTTYVQHVDSHG